MKKKLKKIALLSIALALIFFVVILIIVLAVDEQKAEMALGEGIQNGSYVITDDGRLTVVANNLSPDSVEHEVWTFLIGEGFTPAATAGVMGNIYQESGFKTDAVEEATGEGIGLIQWSGGRKDRYLEYVEERQTEWTDLALQLEYLMYEVNGPEAYRFPEGIEQFKKLTSVEDAAYIWCWSFEAPSEEHAMYERRLDAARRYYLLSLPTDSGIGAAAVGNSEIWKPYRTTATITARWPAYESGAQHKGLDMTVRAGAQINAIADGVVVETVKNVTVNHYGTPGYGNMILIRHESEKGVWYSRYAHLMYGSVRVKVGDTITGGQMIAQQGNTGNSSGTHLHLEMRTNTGAGFEGTFNPEPFITKGK